jgi:sialidase-1
MNLHDRAIQLESGRVLVPLFYARDHTIVVNSGLGAGNPRCYTQVYYSDDEAQTWKPSRTVVDISESRVGAQEPAVIELRDKSLMMLLRNSTGRIYKCYSRDQGESWSKPEPTKLVSPVSPASIKRIPSTGGILIIWNNSPDKRNPLTCALSDDEGRSWKQIKNLDENPQYTYAYTSITFVGTGVLITYYAATDHPSSNVKFTWALKLRNLPVSWFYK